MKSGFVAILGKPNAGKSTLVNTLLKDKIAITTPKAQTTRNAILGIYNNNDCQIIFIDTPGLHKAENSLGVYMNKVSFAQALGVDIIYYLIDASHGLDNEDKENLNKLFAYKVPVFLLVNKIDNVKEDVLISRVAYASNNYDFKEIIPISALNNDNLDELLKVTKNYLNDNVKYYSDETKTTYSLEFRISEIIREKIITNLDKEVPHLVAVTIDEIKEKTSKAFISATIICNKKSHKGIIIGKSGSMLRKINCEASKDIAKIFNKKIVLSLFVKVEEDWLNSSKELFNLGYFIDNE